MSDHKPTSPPHPRISAKSRKASSRPTWSPIPNPLGRAQPIPMDIESVKRQGWRDQKILVISEGDERLDFVEREFVRRIGERLYGTPDQPKEKTHG